ncbi:glycan-binding surface protein [Flavobacterium sp.]|uniref:glycan-binding surface protein n=1 Tax=Flavobacterium sp. TaxID=239 RepID=UPI003D10DB2E
MGTPVITGVRNYVASPNDTIIDSAVAKEQYVVIEGQNLGSALRISFNGVPATFNYSFLTPNHAVVKIPAIVFSQIDVNKLYTIEYVTSEGSTTFSFKLGPEAPVITAISDVFTEPADSIFIYGTNLVLIKKLSYGGTAITSFKPNVSGTSVGFVMPAPAPTSGNVEIDAYGGMAIFKIAADPIIFSISNENAAVNDSVFVYGQYLKGVESFSFGGTTISSYKLNNNGSSIGFVLPSSPQKGPVAITTSFGSVTTFYDVNDIYGTSSLSICDGGDNWQFWAADLYSGDPSSGWPSYTPDFPGTKSQFLVIDQGTLLAGAGQPWDRAIRLDSKNWVAQANINDPVENYALKFEMSIPNAWNGSSMLIQTDNDTYTYRWEPWKISANISKAYSTKGWITVTVPFTEFRAKDAALGVGRGNSMTELISLLGTSGKSGFYLYAHNYSTSATATGFKAAFDNIRVVKVK